MLPRKVVEQIGSAIDPRVTITTDATTSYTYYLEAYEQEVIVDSTLGVGTIYLPDVGSCAGCTVSVTAKTGGTYAVTVAEKSSGNSYDFPGNATLNAADDRVLYQSDGKRWWILTDQYT